jgi:hypothetical protein
MNYLIIKNPPENESDYIKTTPENLMVLLREGADHIMTFGLIGSVSDAIAFSNSKGYKVSMMRCFNSSCVSDRLSKNDDAARAIQIVKSLSWLWASSRIEL